MKQIVRLTEGDLHKIVNKSVKKCLKEYIDPAMEEQYEFFNTLYFGLEQLPTNLDSVGFNGDIKKVEKAANFIKNAISEYCD